MKMKFEFAGFKFEKREPAYTLVSTDDDGLPVKREYAEHTDSGQIEKIAIEVEYSTEELVQLVAQNKELVPVVLDFIRKMK